LTDLEGIRIGVPDQISQIECTTPVLEAFSIAVEALKELGAQLISVNVDGWSPSDCRKAALLLTEAEGAISLGDLLDQEGAISPHIRSALQYGRGLSSEKLVLALSKINAAKTGCHNLFQQVDFLITPTTPQQSFHHDKPAPANQAEFTALANISGYPAIALPVYPDQISLPASVQLMGKPWSESMLLACANLLDIKLNP
jgi:aspartyl-tRNA(Asn)/glutamyl-tRNA(Gln) amidotransferase subunit A